MPKVTTLWFFLIMMISASAIAEPFDHRHRQLDLLLKKHVQWNQDLTNTTVDYAALKADENALDQYLAHLSAVDEATFRQWSKNERLAFLINAYNAFTLKLILDNYPLESIRDIGTFWRGPWKQSFFTLFGKKTHLDHLEHELIRDWQTYGEPRIHFAVNCASVGCPALRPDAYTGESLEQQLEEQTQRFLSDRDRNRLQEGHLLISPIFDWYGEDFEKPWRGSDSLPEFLSKYSDALDLSETQSKELEAGKIRLRFGDYDWNLNDKR